MRISVSGGCCTGKTTAARELAKQLDIEFLCVGELFREQAKRRNLTIVDMVKLALTDTTVDLNLDREVLAYMQSRTHIVSDSRIAHFFFKDSEIASFYFRCSDRIRNIRAAERNNVSVNEASQVCEIRDRLDQVRLKNLYHVDFMDISKYSHVIDADGTIQETVEQMKEFLVAVQR